MIVGHTLGSALVACGGSVVREIALRSESL